MVTLFRWMLLKQKEIKYKLAFWQFVDGFVKEINKNPENAKEKLVSFLYDLVHKSNSTESRS